MTRLIGINRAGSAWITDNELDRLSRQNLWYRVDFRREFGDSTRDRIEFICRAKGVKYLPILIWDLARPMTSTEWEAWKQYVQHVVRRYPQQTWWQVWNEPNNSRVPNTYFGDNLDAWRGFLRRTGGFIKSANPSARVVAGGVAVGGHGSQRINNFYSQWFNVNEIIDRVAIHTYCGDPDEAAKAINNARRVSDQPIWVTELGRKSTVDGEQRQAEWYRRVRSLTGTAPLFWYDLQDVDGAFDGFGAFRRDWTAKPVWRDLT